MSRILGGIGIAHTPSMGYQYDKGVREGFDPASIGPLEPHFADLITDLEAFSADPIL